MPKINVLSVLSLFFLSCSCSNISSELNKEEWINLFNSKDLSDWDIKISGKELNDNYLETFVVEDGMLRVKYDKYRTFDDAFGHLYYKKPFSYYRLQFDYRFLGEQLPGGADWNVRNSGVMLHSQSATSNEIGQDFPVSIEMQLLGGLNDGERTTGNICTPGTAFEMNGGLTFYHCVNSSSETYNGDRWVHAEAIVLGGEAMHFLIEGDTVFSFQKPQISPGFIDNTEGTSDWESFGIEKNEEFWKSKSGEILSEGYIALQAESHPIDFKNIRLLNLKGCMDPKAINYKSYFVKNDPTSCKY